MYFGGDSEILRKLIELHNFRIKKMDLCFRSLQASQCTGSHCVTALIVRELKFRFFVDSNPASGLLGFPMVITSDNDPSWI